MLLSIIVPVYKVEKYIKRCLSSILSINIPESEYEIIVVNDGTPDRSMAIVEEYMKIHYNIIRIDQENKGLSGARNTGIENAKGDYVWFVDSDDYVSSDISSIASVLVKKKPEILCFIIHYLYNDSERYSSQKNPKKMVSGFDYLKLNGYSGAWSYFISRDYINQNRFRFVEGLIHEDDVFNVEVFYKSERVYFAPICCYHYDCRREDSIINVVNLRRIQSIFEVIQYWHDLIDHNNYSTEKILYINKLSASEFNYALSFYKKCTDEQKIFFVKCIKENRKKLCSYLFASKGLYTRFESFLLFLSIHLCIRVHLFLFRQ